MDDARELRRAVISREVERQIDEQKEELQEAIFRGCTETDSAEKIYTKMVLNGIIISAKIIADMTVNMLIDYGLVLPTSEDEIRKSLFSVVEKKEDQRGE